METYSRETRSEKLTHFVLRVSHYETVTAAVDTS